MTPSIPKQSAAVSGIDSVATYRRGPPSPPSINHDNGHLDRFQARPATMSDKLELAKWKALVEIASGVKNIPDAIAAYRHFLNGNGRDRKFSYERYVTSDKSGRITLRNALLSLQWGTLQVWKATPKTKTSFSVTGSAIRCGSSPMFPYPATENWQKAIGGHNIWMSGNVRVEYVKSKPIFNLDAVLHAEDRYNFNPGQHDIATGIPDSANGIFEITGLAHQYTNRATLTRQVRWRAHALGGVTHGTPSGRTRKPSDNRRLRNRL